MMSPVPVLPDITADVRAQEWVCPASLLQGDSTVPGLLVPMLYPRLQQPQLCATRRTLQTPCRRSSGSRLRPSPRITARCARYHTVHLLRVLVSIAAFTTSTPAGWERGGAHLEAIAAVTLQGDAAPQRRERGAVPEQPHAAGAAAPSQPDEQRRVPLRSEPLPGWQRAPMSPREGEPMDGPGRGHGKGSPTSRRGGIMSSPSVCVQQSGPKGCTPTRAAARTCTPEPTGDGQSWLVVKQGQEGCMGTKWSTGACKQHPPCWDSAAV